jgi:hypothetical protein
MTSNPAANSYGCPPVTGVRYIHDTLGCNGYFDKAFAEVERRKPARIVLASNWLGYFNTANDKICFIEGDSCVTRSRDHDWFELHVARIFAGLGETLRKLRKGGAEVVILSTTPYGQINVPAELLERDDVWLNRFGIPESAEF